MASNDSKTDHAFWLNHIAQWQTSKLSQASYCRQQALHPDQFSYWKCKFLANGEPVASETKTGFARVQVAAPVAKPSSPGLSLCFRNDIKIMGIAQDNLALLKQLLEVLR